MSASNTWVYNNRIRVTLCWNPLIDATGCPGFSLCWPNGETMMKRTIAQMDPLDAILNDIVRALGDPVPDLAQFHVVVYPNPPGGVEAVAERFGNMRGMVRQAR